MVLDTCHSPMGGSQYPELTVSDLQRQEHRTIHFETTLGARPFGWEYPDGESYATLQLPGALHVNSAQTYEAAALAGLGLIQAPLLGIGRYLESGALVEIIPDFRRRALAVSLVVAHRSNLSRRVRAFMKWIEDVLTPYLEWREEHLRPALEINILKLCLLVGGLAVQQSATLKPSSASD